MRSGKGEMWKSECGSRKAEGGKWEAEGGMEVSGVRFRVSVQRKQRAEGFDCGFRIADG
jgi:hypothetical protein